MSIRALHMTCKYIPNTPLNTHKHNLFTCKLVYVYIIQIKIFVNEYSNNRIPKRVFSYSPHNMYIDKDTYISTNICTYIHTYIYAHLI